MNKQISNGVNPKNMVVPTGLAHLRRNFSTKRIVPTGLLKHYKTAKLREHIFCNKLSPVWWKYFYATGRYKKLVKRYSSLTHSHTEIPIRTKI